MATQQPDSSTSLSSSRLAKRSCQSCKLRKRKCTREVPECRLCIRGRRSCSYRSVNSTENRNSETNNAVGEARQKNSFPPAVFLDPTLFNCCALPISPNCQIPTPPQVEEVLGDIHGRRTLVAEYFKTANRWMPIISKIRLHESLTNPSRCTDNGVTSILLGMKLILSWPGEVVPSEIYALAKQFLLHMEMVGCISIYTIQSQILLAMYEMGHAILPCAFTTISTCARHAIALGINGTLTVQKDAWVEQEERNRTWWAIIILDRSINLGFRGRHLCTPDPSATSILPIDDDDWEQGRLSENHSQNLLSTPTLKVGRYARAAQAVNLLSNVFRHVSSCHEPLRLDQENILQLDKTLFALEHLASLEEQEHNICCLFSIAICYSSVLLLHTTYLSEQHDMLTESGRAQSQKSIRHVLMKTFGHFQRFRDGWGGLDRFPPLALDWLYRSAMACIFLAHDTEGSEEDSKVNGLEAFEELSELKEALQFVSQRWRAATHYIRLLETRQRVRIPI